jgi:uncharacterized repeat protein (TIGR01451 family)
MTRTFPRWFTLFFVLAIALLARRAGLAAPLRATDLPTDPEQPAAINEDPAWARWEALAPELQAKVDPRILAELGGKTLPTHLAQRFARAMLTNVAPQPLQRTRFVVYLHQQPTLADLEARVYASAAERRAALFEDLIAETQTAQAAVKQVVEEHLAGGGVSAYQPFYVVNALAVDGDLSTLIALAQRADVARIVANYPLVLVDGALPPASESVQAAQLEPSNWNIALVGADRVWNELGVRGEGAVVAGFDTGVTWQHPALLRSYRGNLGNGTYNHNYNWFEPDANLYADGNLGRSLSGQPYDCSGHGSHTMGTMVGDGLQRGTQIGMAPGARWIALPGICDNTMPGGIRDDIGALKAFQWLLCPTDLSGNLRTADCSQAPDVVNNSWGSANPVNDVLRPAIQRLRAAGIAPVFAAGNPNAGDGSIGAPGNAPEAITVGATDRDDAVAYFSGRGPSFFEGEQKPDLSAPGVGVLSSAYLNSYLSASGTSMAAPHVAGLIALIVSADLKDGVRDFSVDEIEQVMTITARDLGALGPDDDYGYGRIEALPAVRAVLASGDLRGVVRDATTNGAVAGALMTGRDVAGNRFTAVSNATGNYSVTVPTGQYAVTVAAWGYLSKTFASQQVLANSLSLADFNLQPQPRATLTVEVRSADLPVIDALVLVADHPTTQGRTDAAGRVALTLPLGDQPLVVRVAGQRVLYSTVAVPAEGGTVLLTLQSAPKILLVEADGYNGWFFGWPIANTYRWALDQQNYQYDEWRIQYTTITDTQTMVDGSLGYGIPSVATLQAYDLVIWAHNGCSLYIGCFYERTDRHLPAYLRDGGKLIISGQDLSQLDSTELYDQYLYADSVEARAAETGEQLIGADFLQGLAVTLTNASLYGYANGTQSFGPDAVLAEPGSGAAYPVLTYKNGAGAAALAVDPCNAPYRAVYLAMGYENIGPRGNNRAPAIAEVLTRSIEWTFGQKPAEKLLVSVLRSAITGEPGRTVRHEVQLVNAGAAAVTVQVQLSGTQWPSRLSGTAATGPITLAPCGTATALLVVDLPATATNGQSDQATVTVTPVNNAGGAHSVQLTTQAFAAWQTEAPMPTQRYRLGAAALPGDLYFYAVGGWAYNAFSFFPTSTDRVERYNTCTQQWERRAPMPQEAANAGTATLDGKLYSVGGHSLDGLFLNLNTHNQVRVYDPAQNTWTQAAALPQSMAGLALVGINGRLYAFGGSDELGLTLNTTWEYDPVSNTWRERAAMPGGARDYAVAATLNGKIYVVGGWPNLDRVEVYDPTTDTWADAAPLNQGRQSPGLVAGPDGYLYVTGGSSGQTTLNSTEQYDPASNQWRYVSTLQDSNRWGVAAAYAGGRLYVVGGFEAVATESLRLASSICLSGKQASSAAVTVGAPLTYTVTLMPDARDLTVQVRDTIPAEVRFVRFLANPINAQYDEAQRQIEWQGVLPANAAPTTFAYEVILDTESWQAGEALTSTTTISTGAGVVFTRVVTNVLFAVDFSTSALQANPPAVRSGEEVTYTVQVRGANVAGGPVTVRSVLPPDVAYVPDSLSYPFGTGHYDASSRTITWQGTVPSGTYAGQTLNYVWGDSDGKGVLDGVAMQWQDIRESGLRVPGVDDAYWCNLPIGFPFTFYGRTENTFCVSTNGFLSFDQSGFSDYTNDCPLPSNLGTNALIAGIWEDLIINEGVLYQTFGEAPNRSLVVQWTGARRYGQPTTNLADFQIVLYENGQFQIQIRRVGVLTGNTSTTGVEGYLGLVGATYACRTLRSLHNDLAIRFIPNNAPYRDTPVSFRVLTDPTAGINQTLVNTTTIATPSGTVTRTAATLVNPIDLSGSTVQLSHGEIVPNATLSYTLVVRNRGLAVANAVLTATIPTATTFVADSLRCTGGICALEGNQLRWAGPVAGGEAVSITVGIRLVAPLPDRTSLTSQVVLSDGHGGLLARTLTFLARRSDLSSSFLQLSPPFLDPGESATVLLFARNTGVLAATAELALTLPVSLTLEEGTLTCGVGTCALDAGVVRWTGSVPARGVVQISFRVKTPDSAQYGDIFASTLTIRDLEWGDTFTAPMSLWVAHGFYFPMVGVPVFPTATYMPVVSRGEGAETPLPEVLLPLAVD